MGTIAPARASRNTSFLALETGTMASLVFLQPKKFTTILAGILIDFPQYLEEIWGR